MFNLIADKRFMHYSDKLRTILDNNYELENKKLVIMGDGANWIKKLAFDLSADYVLDKFHLFKKIKQICKSNVYIKSKNLKQIKKVKQAIYDDLLSFIHGGYVNNPIDYLRALLFNETLDKNTWIKDKKAY